MQGDIFAGIYGYGVEMSFDEGVTWNPINWGLTPLNVLSLTEDGSGYLYCGTSGGIVFRSAQRSNDLLPRESPSCIRTIRIPSAPGRQFGMRYRQKAV